MSACSRITISTRASGKVAARYSATCTLSYPPESGLPERRSAESTGTRPRSAASRMPVSKGSRALEGLQAKGSTSTNEDHNAIVLAISEKPGSGKIRV
jgi:hypothetical protein